MGQIEKIKNSIRDIPEFSEKNYNLAGYIFATLITVAGLFLIYEVVTTDALVFKANWNMFKSPLGNLCWFIGFFWALAWWGKFTHWSSTPFVETRDKSTGRLIERTENYDITEQISAKILMPFLGHFVIEPIIYGAIIYYPIQCIVAVVGTIFPYILSLIVLGIIAGSWMFTRTFQFRYHSVVIVALGIVLTIAFAWGGYAIGKSEPGSTIQMLTSPTSSAPNNQPDQNAIESNETTLSEDESTPEVSEEEEDDQFEGVGEEGLFGSLPNGTTNYEGQMAGFPIEFSITKNDNMGDIKAIYKNVKYGTTMNLTGESLPANGGNISFFGKDGGTDWIFNLSGDVENITGNAQCGDKNLNVSLRKK